MKSRLLTASAALFLAAGCSSEPSPGEEVASSGGSPGTGGALTGGNTSGGAASGGVDSGGGSGGSVSSGGASTGGSSADGGASSGGSPSLVTIADGLVGLRIDDPCAGTPSVSVGATCDHTVLTGAGYHDSKQVSIAGVAGTVYDVTLRVRGVVEPANVVGGSRSGTETFPYMSLDWRSVPFTTGGTVPPDDTDYAQWRLVVANPAQEYFLNDYQRVGHYIFELDYEVTIPMAANTTVTLEAVDDNERLIVNYESYAPSGLAGSVNHGQFVELDVVAVAVH